ncbi:hypothetical protein BD413DRAFT_615785 [Trametes elegans]|nr:hypothetical protein BD413DRAFT_615785 [Trametes elegans]
MSALPQLKHDYFLVYARDQPNAQRAKHIERHIQQNGPLIASGQIRVGGALLPDGSKTTDADAPQKTAGSFLVIQSESADKVWEHLKNDIFYTSGEVWDHEKIFVTPALIATPEAKFD